MSQSDEARNVHPWSRTFRNTDNPTGPDFRPQFVSPDMPYADEASEGDDEPYGGLKSEEVVDGSSGDGDDPKDSTAMASVASSPVTGSSQKGASSRSSEETAAPAAMVEPGAEAPGA